MTEILFYHLTESKLEDALPPLLEKSLERGWKVAIQTVDEERRDFSTRICGPFVTTVFCRTQRIALPRRKTSRFF